MAGIGFELKKLFQKRGLAATAVPITPATFGPIACIRRKFVGSASAPTF